MVEFNFDLSKVVIMIFDMEVGGFNYANGKMIVEPASNRAEDRGSISQLWDYAAGMMDVGLMDRCGKLVKRNRLMKAIS